MWHDVRFLDTILKLYIICVIDPERYCVMTAIVWHMFIKVLIVCVFFINDPF